MILTRAFYHPEEFAEEVAKVERKLIESGKVIRIRHELDYDSTGDPAVYFRIVMPDFRLRRDILLDETDAVGNTIIDELDLPERWGVFPYFRYRSQSAQERMQEMSWA